MMFGAVAYGQNEGIRPWEMRNANGARYFMVSGVDSVMYYQLLDNYIRDTLGYSRIDSIKCVSDTIRIYTNNGQFKMPFACSGGGGGGGDITAVNVTSPITGGGTTGAVSIGADTSILATQYDISSKVSGSGLANRVPYFSSPSNIISSPGFQFDHSSLRLLIGSSLDTAVSFLPLSSSSGMELRGSSKTGLSMATTGGGYDWWQSYIHDDASTGRYAISSDGSGAMVDRFWIKYSTSQPFFSYLASGSDTKLVQASSTGGLSTLANTATSGHVLTANGSGYSWAAPSFSEVDGVIGNEVRSVTGNGLQLNGSGTGGSPYSVALSGKVSQFANLGYSAGLFLQSTSNGLQWAPVSTGSTGLASYGSIYEGYATQQYQYTSQTTAAIKILYQSLATGGNITYNPGSSAGNFIVPSTGIYEIHYGHDVRSSEESDGNEKLWTSVYIDDVQQDGSNSLTTEVYTQNRSYHHTGRIIRSLTSGQAVQVKVAMTNISAPWDIFVSGAQLSLKKLN